MTMTRQQFSILLLLLLPTLSWAQNAPLEEAPTAKAATVVEAPGKPETVIATPPASTLATTPEPPIKAAPAKPEITPTTAVKPSPAAITPALKAPVTPAITKPTPAISNTLPKSAPAMAAPLKPAQSQPVKTAPPAPAKITATPLSLPTPSASEPSLPDFDRTADIEVFVREDCVQCDEAIEFLNKLHKLQADLKISIRDVRKEPAALELLKRIAQNHGETLDYPAFVVRGQLIIGFADDAGTAQNILDIVAATHPPQYQLNQDTENCITGKDLSCGLIKVTPITQEESTALNIFGYHIPLLQISLPLFTLAMGLLDGLNHGSTWALILIISLLSPMKNRPLMFTVAGTFIAVQGVFYFILISAWFNLNRLFEGATIATFVFAGIALLAGIIFLFKYFYYGEKLALTSHEITKPGIYTRIRKIMETEGMFAVILSTASLAILVQLGEITLTSAFPALYTHILSVQHLSALGNYSYLLLYDFAYMLDDAIILTIGLITLDHAKPELEKGKIIKLISGLLMLGLATYMFLVQH